MATRKIKVSELTPVTSLAGYYALGYKVVNGKGVSARLDLGYVQASNDKTVEATDKANKAAGLATKAATDADARMAVISREVGQALTTVGVATGNADDAAELARRAAMNVRDGKTPVLGTVNARPGQVTSGSFSTDGTDPSGNPRYVLDLTLQRGENGKEPVIEYGTTTTGEPGTMASATLAPDGQTPGGNPVYRLSLTIPRGEKGLPGEGSGNVSASGSGLVRGKRYLFTPLSDGSTEGTFVELDIMDLVPEGYEILLVRREA